MACGCEAIILVEKVFHFDHFGGTFASAECPIILVFKTKMTDHFGGKLEKIRGRSFQPVSADHFAPIILVATKNRKSIILVDDHFGGRSLYSSSLI